MSKEYNLTQALDLLHEGHKMCAENWNEKEFIAYDVDDQSIRDENGLEVNAITLMVNRNENWYIYER